MKTALGAIQFLTIHGRLSRAPTDPALVGRAAFYFPIVGLSLGALLFLADQYLGVYLESEILGAILVCLMAIMTGASHFEGVKMSFEEDRLERPAADNRDVQTCALVGTLAVIFIVLLKVRAIEVTGETRGISLLLSPMFARWGPILFLYGASGWSEGRARRIAQSVRAWHLLSSSILVLGSAAFVIGRMALWIGLWISLLVLLTRSILRLRHSVLDEAHVGAVIELGETLTLVLFATL